VVAQVAALVAQQPAEAAVRRMHEDQPLEPGDVTIDLDDALAHRVVQVTREDDDAHGKMGRTLFYHLVKWGLTPFHHSRWLTS
jgi:hypothetical protein